MAKKSKLLSALDAQKGWIYKLEKQKMLQKQAEKRKQVKTAKAASDAEGAKEGSVELNGEKPRLEEESDGWQSDESEVVAPNTIDTSQVDDSDSDSEGSLEEEREEEEDTTTPVKITPNGILPRLHSDGENDNGDEEDDIPLSEIESLASQDKADVLLHQRLTINNTTALLAAHKSIGPGTSPPFSTHQTILSASPIVISDVNDDLNRELAFYKQCLDSAIEARARLKKEGVPFSRPNDYFAEMVKSDEHMGKIKQKMADEAANKRAAAEARKQRDLKKFGKQVQVAKLQERDRAKRDMLGKIDILKRKRKNADVAAPNEEDLFDVALEDATKADTVGRSARNASRGRGPPSKRQKKDQKFGFGGNKRFAKSGDAISSGDMRGFSAKKMKGHKGGAKRLGKSRRVKL